MARSALPALLLLAPVVFGFELPAVPEDVMNSTDICKTAYEIARNNALTCIQGIETAEATVQAEMNMTTNEQLREYYGNQTEEIEHAACLCKRSYAYSTQGCANNTIFKEAIAADTGKLALKCEAMKVEAAFNKHKWMMPVLILSAVSCAICLCISLWKCCCGGKSKKSRNALLAQESDSSDAESGEQSDASDV